MVYVKILLILIFNPTQSTYMKGKIFSWFLHLTAKKVSRSNKKKCWSVILKNTTSLWSKSVIKLNVWEVLWIWTLILSKFLKYRATNPKYFRILRDKSVRLKNSTRKLCSTSKRETKEFVIIQKTSKNFTSLHARVKVGLREVTYLTTKLWGTLMKNKLLQTEIS